MEAVVQQQSDNPVMREHEPEIMPSTSGQGANNPQPQVRSGGDNPNYIGGGAQQASNLGPAIAEVTREDQEGQQPSSPSQIVPQEAQSDISTPPSPVLNSPHHFTQMEAYLIAQLDKLDHYKNFFAKQENTTLANKFETLFNVTTNDLEIVRTTWQECGQLPRFAFERVQMTCVPTNVDVKERELMITVKISGLPVEENATIYVIGEFEYPLTGKQETLAESIGRWSHNIKIEPSKFFKCFTRNDRRQLDMIYSTDLLPFYEADSKQIHFDRALKFFVDKGKSRTLKRKFKPVKLTFYKRTNILSFDKKIGSVQIKIDAINDESTIMHRPHIMFERKRTDACVDIISRVREPLVDKSLRVHEEKVLVLT